jgi:multidrug efflux pump subunit AcrA (membrane-fusion protein)
VEAIGRTVRRKSWRVPAKVYKVQVGLDRTDATFMRPAMRFRGEIETGRLKARLVVPRDAVFLRESGPVVFARRGLRWAEVPVRLGRNNRKSVEILDGVREGDRILPVDPTRDAGDKTGPSLGAAG